MQLPSKRVIYVLIAFILGSFSFIIFPVLINQGVFSQGFGENLSSEFIGLLVTLFLFVVIIEARDVLAWKKVEKRVKERIGRQTKFLFNTFIDTYGTNAPRFIGMEPLAVDVYRKSLIELKNKILEDPEKFELSNRGQQLVKADEFMLLTTPYYETRRIILSDLEGKYWRFLNPEIQTSLMNIQDELEALIIEFQKPFKNNVEKCKLVENIMRKIIQEIKILKDKGIDVVF